MPLPAWLRFVLPAVLVTLIAVAASQGQAGTARSARAVTAEVVVPRGEPVQIAFVGSSDFPTFTQSFRNAIRMAIEQHPTIRGFSIEVNESDPPCFSGSDPDAANIATAKAIVDEPQNTAVIGHVCSIGFRPALPIYEAAGIVTISGSATMASLPSLGPTVFNRTAVADPDGDAWYALIKALPSDVAFRAEYEAEFASVPADFTDLYFDAARLLLRRLQHTSRLDSRGNLVIDRMRLARAVRDTRAFQAVSCTVTLDASGNRVNDAAALARCAEG